MAKFELPVTWQVNATVTCEAESYQEAVANFDPTDHDLPNDGAYVDGSFALDLAQVEADLMNEGEDTTDEQS